MGVGCRNGFKRSFLWKYEREEHEDWLDRLQRTAYENLLLDIIKRRESLLFSRKILRSAQTSKREILEKINNNIDAQGTLREQFIKKDGYINYFNLFSFFGDSEHFRFEMPDKYEFDKYFFYSLLLYLYHKL